LIFLMLAFAASAMAAAPELLLRAPAEQTQTGAGAAELNHPRGIAVDPDTGHLFVAELQNARISEYTAWGLFVKSWGWGVADGSAELQTCGPFEPEEDPDPSLCREGTPGAASGQFGGPFGVAVDDNGEVYVYDLTNFRIQKFSPAGQFQLMFGGDVNKTKVEAAAPAAQRNVCPFEPGDVCQAGASGEGPSQLSGGVGNYIAYSSTEHGIVVGDKDGIQIFNLDGSFKEEIPFEGPLAAFAGETVNALDIDEDGSIYFSLSGLDDLYKLDPAGSPVAPGKPDESKFAVEDPMALAVDPQGNVYGVKVGEPVSRGGYVVGFDALGNPIDGMEPDDEFGQVEIEVFPEFDTTFKDDLVGIATNQCSGSEGSTLLITRDNQSFENDRSYISAYGPGPIGCELPPPKAPAIVSQFATSVGRGEAMVKARTNPKFWPDVSYYVQYGTDKCSLGGCPGKAPVEPVLLTGKVVNFPVATAGVLLDGLEPGTTYHYRFVAESGGGGPVFGIDPDGDGLALASAEEGLEATFRTFRAVAGPSCPNDAVRIGTSGKLPDCRAYEMVSPLDKGGGDVAAWIARNGEVPHFFEMDQSAASGDRFTYTSTAAYDAPESAPFVSQHLSERSAAGWESRSISPPRTESVVPVTALFHNEFRGFSDDLCSAWIRQYAVAPLTEKAVEKYPNLYKRHNCGQASTYEALSTAQPPNRVPGAYGLNLRGFSEDGSHTIFTADDDLYDDAPTLAPEETLLYERTPEGLRFVCYFPSGEPNPTACSAGTLAGVGATDLSSLHNAISADGSRIFWTAYSGATSSQKSHPGQIYVRIDGMETREISGTVTSEPAFFWTAAEDGSKAIFEVAAGPLKGDLYELDVDTETLTLIAGEVEGPMGASEDASRIYLVSKEDLDDIGPASTGAHNLYLYEADPGGGGGDFTFIMELVGPDIGSNAPSATDPPTRPVGLSSPTRAAFVSDSGGHATFLSAASPTPTGFDNLDATNGQPLAQIYLYDAAEDELRCVSCNPTGSRPTGVNLGFIWAAARIQGWEFAFHAPRVLTDDGTRVFFESFEALVPRDTNGTWDVYQWEEEGKGTCTDQRETFNEDSGGCVNLISSGLSSAKSTFLDADPSGENIFFSTQSSLVGQDYGLNDVYVARVGGGFPEPKQKTECEGEACQSPPPPPPEVTPSTETAAGPGNVPTPLKPKRRPCPKGTRRVRRGGKARCVKRKGKGKKARANKTRRARR
jgi:DNA-binding beta-propeller fold protein YncE